MTRISPFLVLAYLFFNNFLFAQSCTLDAQVVLHGNNMRIGNLSTSGNFFAFGAEGSFSNGYNGSDNLPIAGVGLSSFWLGGISASQNVEVVYERVTSPYYSAFLPGPLGPDGSVVPGNCTRWDRIWSVTINELQAHHSDFADNGVIDQPISSIVGWPGKGNPHFVAQYGFALPTVSTAPFFDQNNDGIYNAFDGDFPHPANVDETVPVGQILWSLVNGMGDAGTIPTPMPFEFGYTAWVLPCSDNDILNNTVFFSRSVVNRGVMAYDSVFYGQWNDYALGAYLDDAGGNATDLSTTYFYNTDNFDQNGFGENPPAMAFTYLNRALSASLFFNNPSVGNPAPATTDPSLPQEYYYALNGQWRDGSSVVHNGLPEKIMYSGSLNQTGSWTMLGDSLLPFTDRRALSSVYLGKMEPGVIKNIDMAYSFHRGTNLNHIENVAYLLNRVGQLRADWNAGLTNVPCSRPVCTANSDCVWPGDANTDGIVNHLDLLPYSVALNQSGVPRASTSLFWAGEVATDWNVSYQGMYDYKHIDANGDGVVGEFDQLVMRDFYGNTRLDYQEQPVNALPGKGFYMKKLGSALDTNAVLPNQTVFLRLMLDTLPDLYGAACTVVFDPEYWTVSGANLQPVIQSGKVIGGDWEVAISSGPGTQLSPDGQGTLVLVSKNTLITAPDTTYVHILSPQGVYSDGTPYPIGGKSMRFIMVPAPVSVEEVAEAQLKVEVFPNPAQDYFQVVVSDNRPIKGVLSDVNGREVAPLPASGVVQVMGLPAGVYVLTVALDGQVWKEKVVVGR